MCFFTMGTYDSTMLAAQSEENAKMASLSLQAAEGGGRGGTGCEWMGGWVVVVCGRGQAVQVGGM